VVAVALAVDYVVMEAAKIATNFAERPTAFQLSAMATALVLTFVLALIAGPLSQAPLPALKKKILDHTTNEDTNGYG
jgi:hypothetical protein